MFRLDVDKLEDVMESKEFALGDVGKVVQLRTPSESGYYIITKPLPSGEGVSLSHLKMYSPRPEDIIFSSPKYTVWTLEGVYCVDYVGGGFEATENKEDLRGITI